MQRASYVSCQSALAFYGLIPEIVHTTLSVTAARPRRWETPLGAFEFHHVRPGRLRGYRMTDLGAQQALVATPEKALLDLVYLQPGGDAPDYLRELRLQNLERLNPEQLLRQAEALASPKLRRAAETITRLIQSETQAYETL
jgi:predicted transcriptional regulator of viral defense system